MKKIQAHLVGEIISSNDPEANSLYKKSHFGEPIGEKIQYSIPETLFLSEKGKIEVFSRGKKITKKDFKNKITVSYFETSAKTGINVDRAFFSLVD